MRKDQIVNLALNPRKGNLGAVGAALVRAAKEPQRGRHERDRRALKNATNDATSDRRTT